MKPKVCFLIPGFADGGAQKQCIHLMNALQRTGCVDLSCIYFSEGVHFAELIHTNIVLVHKPVASNYDPRNILMISGVLQTLRPDLLVTWLHSCDVYGFFIKIMNRQIIWLMTERDSNYPADLRYILRRMVGRFADGIISNSNAGDRYWESANARGRRFVVDNIVELSAKDVTSCRASILSVGRLERQKNPLVLTQAFCEASELIPDVDFLVIGEGSMRAPIEKQIELAGKRDKVKLIGFRRNVKEYMNHAKVVVSLSFHEGLPNVVLEAVGSGCLVVASDIPEHRSILGPEYPFYVKLGTDPAACAKVIKEAYNSCDSEALLAHGNRRLSLMTPEIVASSYMSIFAAMFERS